MCGSVGRQSVSAKVSRGRPGEPWGSSPLWGASTLGAQHSTACGGLQPTPLWGFQLWRASFRQNSVHIDPYCTFSSLSGVTTSMAPPTAHQEHKLNQVTTDQVGKMWFRVEVICGVVRVAWPGLAWYLAPGVPGDTWYQVHQGGQVARVK